MVRRTICAGPCLFCRRFLLLPLDLQVLNCPLSILNYPFRKVYSRQLKNWTLKKIELSRDSNAAGAEIKMKISLTCPKDRAAVVNFR